MIELDAVSVTYPGSDAPAVDDFSYRISPGQTTVLVGPSGCGKTTLLRLINRMVEPTRGTISIDGTDVSKRKPVELRRSIGYVMQNSGLLPHYTAIDNVAAVARLSGASKQEARDNAARWLETVHLDSSLFDRYPAELSGGQAQRVGVARGLVADPNIVLMDEPFGAVDPVVRRELQQEILDIQSKVAKTIVMVTHDIDEALLLGDDIIMLSDRAHIEQHGTAEDFITAPATSTVSGFIGIDSKRLHVETRGGRNVLVDRKGNVIGVVDQPDGPSREETGLP